eukprot:CAMPEP_0180168476 /NCGR_PEP_ID=MMETSP0986-20121125/32699_1 /TAXON_ID=697907 /ORGANISM="non described non described, Strain CCMP2293" /LENGTH=227 /DNA_ID=CAMNT_0022119873 /DNA_START=11 /DNA_END=694 /DNA_ORIENTATION=-
MGEAPDQSNDETRGMQMMKEHYSQGDGEMDDLRDMPSGGVLWKASLVLLDYLERKQADTLKGKRVLELGSGLGHMAVELYRLGAHVVCTEQVAMGALQRLQTTVAEAPNHSAAGGSISAMELEWGEAGWTASTGVAAAAGAGGFDIVVMSELVFDESVHEELLWTLEKSLSPQGTAFSVFLNRPFSMMFFVNLSDAGGFEVKSVAGEDIDMLGMLTTDLHMHIITRV